uniref:Uncharacterized protein n=1 Tax=Arundo donax TaxID=35708 RepID=A0A0A9EHT1_ARUDO
MSNLLSMSSRPPSSSDAPDDTGAATAASTEPLDSAPTSSPFSSAGE